MKSRFLKTFCFALAAAACMPAAAGVPFQIAKTVGGLAKTTEEGTNVLPAFVRAGGAIKAATTGAAAVSNAARVEAAVKNIPAGFDRNTGEQTVKYAAENIPSDLVIKENPYNLKRVSSLIPPSNKQGISFIPPTNRQWTILTVGDRAVQGDYFAIQKFVYDMIYQLENNWGKNYAVALVSSPVIDRHSVSDMISTVAQENKVPLVYIAADNQVADINPDKLPWTIDKKQYIAAPKYIVSAPQACSVLALDASNVLLIIGGGERVIPDFVGMINKNGKVIIIDNPELGPVNWNAAENQPDNSLRYLSAQLEAFETGKSLPYREAGEFNKAFLQKNKDVIIKNVLMLELRKDKGMNANDFATDVEAIRNVWAFLTDREYRVRFGKPGTK